MILGRVCGVLYSTIQHPFYEGTRQLIVDHLTPEGTPTGRYLVAIDSVDAGVGDTVLVIDEGNSARQVVDDADAPLRSIVIGIVDEVQLQAV